jgi:acetyl-CoA acetyltransferase
VQRKRETFVTGVAETALGEVQDETELSMAAKATLEALSEAGLPLSAVDAIFTNYMGEEGSVQVGEYLGITPKYADSTDLGGAAFEAFINHADIAIKQGRCEVALLVYASRQRSLRSRSLVRSNDPMSIRNQFEAPYGLPMPIGQYALLASRYMHQFGVRSEELAAVAVAASEWASLNPKAWRKNRLSIEDVLQSKMVASPLHRLDCCLVTDGGGAVIVTDAAHAAEALVRPVRVAGAGESHAHWHIDQHPPLDSMPGRQSARMALRYAGIGPSDVDVLQPYDSFTISVLLALEDIGFCGPGEAGHFVTEGSLRPGGRLPSMTSGGGLSYNHPGALGLLLIIEAVRQIRGECGQRQVLPVPETAVCHGIGGFMSTAATVVLAKA